ncbi:MAG: PrsW family intramembrane metalloprotease [Oscillospiraceae bacterium]|nr:PrsW family intramembrane metalloprotease [Oscillospiraceae bacterium]MCL2279399.1 PrsW family intramembrane metalloprotease [Oscillospiraceae bacterium]
MGELQFQFISSFFAVAIPLMFIVFMLGKCDSRRILLYFCWGLFSGVLAFNLNIVFGKGQYDRVVLTIAPIIEEIAKAFPVMLFLLTKKRKFTEKLIVLCAMASGFGFSAQESMYYFAASSREVGDLLALLLRSLTTSLMHGMTTAFFGIGLIMTQKLQGVRIPIIFGLLALCTGIHSLFNLLLQTNLAVVAVIMPVVMFFAGWTFLHNYKENGVQPIEEDKSQ